MVFRDQSLSARLVKWILAALLLWGAAEATRLKTEILIEHDGTTLQYSVAGTSVAIEAAPHPVRHLEIWTIDSLVRLGGRRLTAISDGHVVLDLELPRRFDCREPGAPPPIGDWWIDRKLRPMMVLHEGLLLEPPYSIRLTLTGRAVAPMTVLMDDGQFTRFRFQRGLLDNDLQMIRESPGESQRAFLAPRPGDHGKAIVSLLLRSLGGGCLLVAASLLAAAWWRRLGLGAPAPHTRGSPRYFAACVAVVLAIAATALAAWVATGALERLPHTPDGTAYLLQSKWLLDGHLTRETPPDDIAPHLRFPFSFFVGDRWIFQYPVVWPLVLAAGQLVGAPHLVTGLFGGLLVLLVYLLGREIADRTTALLAALLALLSPLSTLLAASFLSHSAAAVGVAAFLWLMLLAVRRRQALSAFAAGLAIGFAFGMRPLTAVAVAACIGAWLMIESRRSSDRTPARILIAVTCGGVLGCVPTMIGNALVTGSPLVFPYELVHSGVYGGSNLALGLRNLDMLLAATVPMLHGWVWPLPWSELALALPLGIVLVPFLLGRSTRHDRLLAAVYVAVVAAYIGTAWNGLHGFGPRYHFEVWICLYLLSARGFRELAFSVGGDRRHGFGATAFTVALATVLLVGSVIAAPARYTLYRGYNFVDGDLARALEAADLGPRAVLVTDERQWFDWGRTATIIDGDPDGDLVVVSGAGDLETLHRAFPDRRIWRWQGSSLEEMKPLDAVSDGAPTTR